MPHPMTKKRPIGRPRTEKGQRHEIVKVSLHADELAAILKATDAPAAFLREHGLKAAEKLDGARNHPKKSRTSTR